MSLFPAATHWDIFCNVIDNFGDIGVCWRLAKQLANEQQQIVTLWVDNLISFQKICPNLNPFLSQQQIQNVNICHWVKDCFPIEVADIVIEAFGCNIPKAYIAAMGKANKAILWLNLEYLTYEDWSISYHTLPSLQNNGLNKYFFFMGHPATGGLIREAKLFEQQTYFQTYADNSYTFLKELGITKQKDSLLMLIFSYANSALANWIDKLKQGSQKYHLIIPETVLVSNLANYLNIPCSKLTAGYCHQQGALTLQIIPFVAQENFDQLLWSTDINIIRGEDSFTRAQLAGKPLIWHIYPQAAKAHLTKLEAFLNFYLIDVSPPIRKAIFNFHLAWNNQQNLSYAWQIYQKYLPEIQKHAKIWVENQKIANDLVTKLANFYKNWLS